MIGVGQDEEDVLEDRNIELSEKEARRLRIGLGHVVHKLKAHAKAGIFHLAVVMFACPHARVNNKFELTRIQLKKCWEAIKVDRLKELEKADPMFWKFVEILVNHLQSAFEHTFHDNRDLVFHKVLFRELVDDFR